METPLEILMGWIIQENKVRAIDVVDVYNKTKELLEYEKEYIKNDVDILN